MTPPVVTISASYGCGGRLVAAEVARRLGLALVDQVLPGAGAAEGRAALSSTMLLTTLVEAVGGGAASDEDRAVHRLLVNANKYVTSVAATDVVHRAIELLGGNGTIEDFSPLPRLYRDAIVFESWEGTHNVLCAQVRRDLSRLDLLDAVVDRIRGELSAAGEAARADGAAVAEALDRVGGRLRRELQRGGSPAEVAAGAANFRRNLDTLTRTLQAAALLGEAAAAEGAVADEQRAVAGLLVRRHLQPGHDPESDPRWQELVEAALGADAG